MKDQSRNLKASNGHVSASDLATALRNAEKEATIIVGLGSAGGATQPELPG